MTLATPSSCAAGGTPDGGGLSAQEVAARVVEGRTNVASRTPTRTYAEIVRANVLTRFNALLGGMLVLILVVGPLQDALFGLVIVFNAGIGIVQEVRAKRTLDRLVILAAPRATVVRDGSARQIAVESVVQDDVLQFAAGNQVVVDGVVLDSTGLEVDESLLTGESDPVMKALGDDVLSGSFVVAGSGRYRAVRVGDAAYAAKMAQEARGFVVTASELRAGINRVLTYISWAIAPTAALLFWSQIRGQPNWRQAVSGAVAGTVAMVPEGLVLLLSIAFAVAVVRLARRRVLVQELAAVEVLARVDVVCLDKTGTLTEGTIQVEGFTPLPGANTQEVEAALRALAHRDAAPNATMRAIAARWPCANPLPGADGAADGWEPTDVEPFSSARKWSGMAFGGHGAWLVGGPDVLLPAATPDARDPVGIAALDTAQKAADSGCRVLLLASAPALSHEDVPAHVRPQALLTFGERVRPDAADTLRYFAEQQVDIKVLSGDNPRTVASIAATLGMPGAEAPIDARTLPSGLNELAAAVDGGHVFGRVTPEQKRAIVAALQANGHTVAMTGDGVNDALALKQADIGVAMGNGSDATRAVAQLVLLDSDFAALPQVVAEGRRVLGNIERTSALYLTKTVYAMLLSLATGAAGLAFPFLPRHLTLIASLTIGIPSFFLALAPNTQRFRPGFVRRVMRFCVPAGILAGVAVLLAYQLSRSEAGLSAAQQRTTAAMTLLWVGLAVLSIIAGPQTRWRLSLIGSTAAAFLLVLAVPQARAFFALQTPPLLVWLAAVGIAAIVWSSARLFLPDLQAEPFQPSRAGGTTPSRARVPHEGSGGARAGS